MSKVTKKTYYEEVVDNSSDEISVKYVENNNNSIFELEKHLHEQYAINNNSKAGILTSLIGSLLVILTGHGFVLYQYRIDECNDVSIVTLVAVVAQVVMALLYCICVNLGAGQRKDQFITFAIRKKYYVIRSKYDEIFPDGYHPFNKTFCSFVQGVYNIWTKATIIVIWGIVLCQFLFVEPKGLVLIGGFMCTLVCILYRCTYFNKYKETERLYIDRCKSFLPQIKDDRKCYCKCKCFCIAFILLLVTSFIMSISIHMCKKHCKTDKIEQVDSLTVKLDNVNPVLIKIVE